VTDAPVLSAAGLIVALSAPLGCAAYIGAVDVDHTSMGLRHDVSCYSWAGWLGCGGRGATQPKAMEVVRASSLVLKTSPCGIGMHGRALWVVQTRNARACGWRKSSGWCSRESGVEWKGKN
jgi:hypothetical protein